MKPTPSRMHVCDLNQYWDFKLRKVESIQMMENTVPSVSHKPSEVNLCITHNLLGTMLVICSFGEWPKKSHLFVVVLTPIILIKKKVWIWGQPSTCIQGWRGSTTPLTLWWKQYLKKKKRSRSESATICLWWPGLHLKIGGGALTKLTWQSCVPLLATAG